jgi:phage baseplate assembly protein gpV
MLPTFLERIVVEQMHRIEELERKLENRTRTGKVAEVDAEKGLARVEIDKDKDGKPVLSPWIPWKEPAMGAIKTHFPPEVGEQVKITSESGDITDAVIDYSLPSNDNARPHDKPREGVITIGDMRVHMTGDRFHVKAGTIVFEGTVHLGGEGGKLVHRKDDLDSDGDAAVGSASKVYAV